MSMMRILLLSCASLGISSVAWAQSTTYKPGDFQSPNPNLPGRNPFYFEGRIDWNLLKIDQPSNAWEFAQRGIYKQDDLEDFNGAIADYRAAYSRNNLTDGNCQLITMAPATLSFGQNTIPPPCMFTFRLRLANLINQSAPLEAIGLFQEVLTIDPLRLGVNQMIGDTYQIIAAQATNSKDQTAALNSAVAAYKAELALSPVSQLTANITADQANNAHTHWALAAVYHALSDANEACELDSYLKATRWHSDTYVWRINLAQIRLKNLSSPCPAK